MRAATQHRYGIDAITIDEVPIPQPGTEQVRVQVSAASINPADWHLASGIPGFLRLSEGLRRPKQTIVGWDACGVIDAVGPDVTEWQVGDAVFGKAAGAFAEYAIADVDRVARVPATMSDFEAATLPVAAVTALQAMELGEVAGKRVVVNGASGGVGHFAVQLARAEGAAAVVAVCSGRNAQWVRELGADEVIDYEEADFTDREFDVVIDCIGNRKGRELVRCLPRDGRWVLLGADKKSGVFGPMPFLLGSIIAWKFRSQRCLWLNAEVTTERLTRLAELVDAGSLSVRIAGKRPLHDVVDAYDRIESKRTAGKIIILP